MKRVMMIAMMLGIIPMLAVGQEVNKPAATALKMMMRIYDVLPNVGERDTAQASDVGGGGTSERDWKQYFAEMGVPWPEGSSIKYLPANGKIVVVNTEENLKIFDNVFETLKVVPSQIEIEAQFVEYKRSDIDALAKQGMVNTGSLVELWQKGQAELLGAPKVITQSGQEATVKGVVECIYLSLPYANEAVSSGNGTNANPSVASECHAEASGGFQFETREVGAILKVTPEVSTDGNMINLTMSPECTWEPTWKKYTGKMVDKNGKEIAVEMEQPFFRTQTVTTSVSIKDGAKILVGGGMPNARNDKLVYMFVTVRLIDAEGKPLKPRDDLLEKAVKVPTP
jgi:type II secretory pathway component GspD/PulD (secretin)